MLRRPELKKFAPTLLATLFMGATAASPIADTADDARDRPEEICVVARCVAVTTAVLACATYPEIPPQPNT